MRDLFPRLIHLHCTLSPFTILRTRSEFECQANDFPSFQSFCGEFDRFPQHISLRTATEKEEMTVFLQHTWSTKSAILGTQLLTNNQATFFSICNPTSNQNKKCYLPIYLHIYACLPLNTDIISLSLCSCLSANFLRFLVACAALVISQYCRFIFARSQLCPL